MILAAMTSAVRNNEQFNSKELEAFIKAIAKGDKQAFVSFYEQAKTAIYGFSLSILKNPHDAEDVLQNTLIKIYYSAKDYIPQGKPMAWVFTIARNLALMKLREQQKTADTPEEEWSKFYSENNKAPAEDRIVLETALEKLDDIERQIVMLHAVSGFKHREIADAMKMPLSTVLSKYHRAIKRLKTLLKEE